MSLARDRINVGCTRAEWERCIRPQLDWVFFIEQNEVMTEAGLELPRALQGDAKWNGVVVAAGPGIWRDGGFVENTYKPGDKVICHPMHGAPLRMNIKTTDTGRSEFDYWMVSPSTIVATYVESE